MLYKFGAAWLNLHVVSGMKIARNVKFVVRCFWNNGASIHPSSIVTPPVIGHIFRLFRYAYPSGSLRCSRKRPSLLSLACASGRLSFAVGERYYGVYFLSAVSFHVRTYADASFHMTIQARSTNTRFTYVQSSTPVLVNIQQY